MCVCVLCLQINHPLDCPICDQGGECDLQDQVSRARCERVRWSGTMQCVRSSSDGVTCVVCGCPASDVSPALHRQALACHNTYTSYLCVI